MLQCLNNYNLLSWYNDLIARYLQQVNAFLASLNKFQIAAAIGHTSTFMQISLRMTRQSEGKASNNCASCSWRTVSLIAVTKSTLNHLFPVVYAVASCLNTIGKNSIGLHSSVGPWSSCIPHLSSCREMKVYERRQNALRTAEERRRTVRSRVGRNWVEENGVGGNRIRGNRLGGDGAGGNRV